MKLLKKTQQKPPARRFVYGAQSLIANDVPRPVSTHSTAFRRNRTLTGSLSSEVQSVNEHAAELRSPRVHVHGLRHRRRRLSILLILSVSGALLMAWLVYQSIATVMIRVSGVNGADTALYQRITQEYLNRYPLERFRFSLDTVKLTEYMQMTYPEVDHVLPGITYGDALGTAELIIAVRKPVVVWHATSSQLYVDANGNAFTRNFFTTPLVEVIDKSGVQAHGNQVLVSNRFLSFIGTLVGKMRQQGYEVTQVTLPLNSLRQVEVSLADIAYPIKFSVDRPVGEQVEDADRSVRYLKSNGSSPEYLDVRVSGKAFYK